MKTSKNIVKLSLIAVISLFFTPIMGMKTTVKPEQMQQMRLMMAQKLVQNKQIGSTLNPIILTGHTGKGTAARMSENGKVFATCADGDSNNIIVWNVKGKMLQTITVPGGNIKDVEVNNDGSRIITRAKIEANTNGNEKAVRTLVLWNALTGKAIKTLDIPQGQTNAECSNDGSRIIIEIDPDNTDPKTENSYVCIVDSSTGKTILTHKIEDVTQDASSIVDPTSKTFIIPAESALYDLTTGAMINKLEGINDPAYGASYSADGTKIIYSDRSAGNVIIWDSRTGKKLTQLNTSETYETYDAVLNSDGTKMLARNSNQELSLWDVATKTQLWTVHGKQDSIAALAFSPDNTLVVSAGEGEDNIIVWDAKTGKQIGTLNGHPGFVEDIKFSTDGKRIEAHSGANEGEEKCTVTLFDVKTGKLIHTFIENHEALTRSHDLRTYVSPDNNNDNNFILWTSYLTQAINTQPEQEEIRQEQPDVMTRLFNWFRSWM
jgi:WD40 repeat protein